MSKTNLLRLLNSVRRKQYVGGKPFDQVTSCDLRVCDGQASVTTLVKDGKTSVCHFVMDVDDAEDTLNITIPDIDRLVGVLSAHGENVRIIPDDNKIVVKSTSKQTTLLGDPGALAYPHSTHTISEWAILSDERAASIDITECEYVLSDGERRSPMVVAAVSADDLYEAVRCDSMNAQKLNRYTFDLDEGVLSVIVGSTLKGQTKTQLDAEMVGHTASSFGWDFEGGLEFVLQQWTGHEEPCHMYFYDFRPEGQGIRMLLVLPDSESWVFQVGVL
tara:strand:+ start:897 stop:1721 length:825 start_codon:yes stop_codon:yes gene_type:complete